MERLAYQWRLHEQENLAASNLLKRCAMCTSSKSWQSCLFAHQEVPTELMLPRGLEKVAGPLSASAPGTASLFVSSSWLLSLARKRIASPCPSTSRAGFRDLYRKTAA